MRAVSIAEILTNIEGVDVGAAVGKTGGQTINIRGMGSDYTLILIDGRRQNTAGSVTPNGFGETSSSFMPPVSAIERVEVVRGPVSTLYGSDAMGGVVNIITRKVGDVWGGSASANYTLQGDDDFGDLWGGDFYANGPATVLPLALFAWSARRLPLSTLGFIQFLAPTLQFTVGVWAGEARMAEDGGITLTRAPALIHAGADFSPNNSRSRSNCHRDRDNKPT